MTISLLEETHKQLGWASQEQILNPTGIGPSVFLQLAKEKIGKAISKYRDAKNAKIGLLTGNPESPNSELPIAIICDFQQHVSNETLKELHKIAWNFSRSPLLITLEPTIMRVWTCCEPPEKEAQNIFKRQVETLKFNPDTQTFISEQVIDTLRWVNLVSGEFFKKHEERFEGKGRVDRLLLSNLQYVRKQLCNTGISPDIVHALLARIIFIQFLFQRKDSKGIPALTEEILERLNTTEILSKKYKSLEEILYNFDDTYNLFKWLNDKFNGDLFLAKATTDEERNKEWQIEMQQVKVSHLSLLADFVGGKTHLESKQILLWQQYLFDTIPLELISNIYQEFISEDSVGAYYTPSHIVDFILDSVLPWEEENWDLRILDPGCGSGIFLVKAFQRLVYRWKKKHPHKEIDPETLQHLLKHNIFGIDKDTQATKSASLSLYLAMCDEIDPGYYWSKVKFPQLCNKQLINLDFFDDRIYEFFGSKENTKFDLIIGNAPWGKNSMTECSKIWARTTKWQTFYKNIGPLFLPRSAEITKNTGIITLIQPAAILFNEKAKELRSKIFQTFAIEEITNISLFRFITFATEKSPDKKSLAQACIITMRPTQPDGEPFFYLCPKPTNTTEDNFRITILPQDINHIYPNEAVADSTIWAVLMWGTRRDLVFIHELSKQTNLGELETNKKVNIRQGIIRGNNPQAKLLIEGKRLLDQDNFPQDTFLYLQADDLPINQDPYVHRATDLQAFSLPQLVIKQTWQKDNGRFRATITKPDASKTGVICSGSYLSVHSKDSLLIDSLCLVYNSKLTVYLLFLTNGQFIYRQKPNVSGIKCVPIPMSGNNQKSLVDIKSYDEVDEYTKDLLNIKSSEWVLIEDLFDYCLPDFLSNKLDSPGRKSTKYKSISDLSEPYLTKYCEYFLRVLNTGFDETINLCATIFHETSTLPLRIIAIHFNWVGHELITIEKIDSSDLYNKLNKLNELYIKNNPSNGGVFYQRIVKIFDVIKHQGISIPTIYIIKPDEQRFWTRSIGLRDADEVVTDMVMWQSQKSTL